MKESFKLDKKNTKSSYTTIVFSAEEVQEAEKRKLIFATTEDKDAFKKEYKSVLNEGVGSKIWSKLSFKKKEKPEETETTLTIKEKKFAKLRKKAKIQKIRERSQQPEEESHTEETEHTEHSSSTAEHVSEHISHSNYRTNKTPSIREILQESGKEEEHGEEHTHPKQFSTTTVPVSEGRSNSSIHSVEEEESFESYYTALNWMNIYATQQEEFGEDPTIPAISSGPVPPLSQSPSPIVTKWGSFSPKSVTSHTYGQTHQSSSVQQLIQEGSASVAAIRKAISRMETIDSEKLTIQKVGSNYQLECETPGQAVQIRTALAFLTLRGEADVHPTQKPRVTHTTVHISTAYIEQLKESQMREQQQKEIVRE